MPSPTRKQTASDEPHVLPLRAVSGHTVLAGLLESLAVEVATERLARGLGEVSLVLDVTDSHAAEVEPSLLREAIRPLLVAACDAAAKAAPRLREVVVTSVAGPAGLEIEVADSGPGPEAGTLATTTAARPIVERLGGTLVCSACPDGGSAVTLRLPHRGLRRQAA